MPRRKRAPLAWWLVAMLDLAAIGVAFYVFALFHHVMPREDGAALYKTAEIAFTPDELSAVMEGLPTETRKPTAVGDFSATFPASAPEGADAAHHFYRDENCQILIEKVRRSGVTYFTADVYIRNISYLKTAFANNKFGRGQYQTATKLASQNGAIVAISGDYYGAHENGVVIRNGYLYRNKPLKDVCVLYQNGEMKIHDSRLMDIDEIIENNAYQAWSFGPRLLSDGEPLNLDDFSIADKNPRCAIGYYEPGHYVFVVVDGRQSGYSSGLTLTHLSELMAELNCTEAYNLDGGQSASMVYENEFVNQPYGGGRKISDIIYIGG